MSCDGRVALGIGKLADEFLYPSGGVDVVLMDLVIVTVFWGGTFRVGCVARRPDPEVLPSSCMGRHVDLVGEAATHLAHDLARLEETQV